MIDYVGNGDRYGLNVTVSIEEQPLGTAGAVKFVEDKLTKTFIVASGDVFCDVDFKALYDFHIKSRADATMALTEVNNPGEFGIVGTNSDGRIERFLEKPKPEEAFSKMINAGIYVLEPKTLSLIPTAEKFDFSRNLFPKMLEDGKPIYAHALDGMWRDIGRPEDTLSATIDVMINENGPDKVTIEDDTDISGDISIKGPSHIKDKVTIGKGSFIGASYIGEGCKLGNGVFVKNCLLLDGCIIGDGSQIAYSIVSYGAVIGPGSRIVASVIGDEAEIWEKSTLEQEKVPSKKE